MKPPPRPPTEPRPAQETTRHSVIDLLGEQPLSAKEISGLVHITEKEVYSHLEHIRRSLHAGGGVLEVTPPACRGCGFVFAKRDRLTSPGKCPVCRHEAISEPRFAIRQP